MASLLHSWLLRCIHFVQECIWLLQEDVVVRALRFLEGFLQRDALQKAAFLKDLEGLWSRCDTRVLRYRVLPPLLAESRNEALQPVILPLVMRIVQKQESQAGLVLTGKSIWCIVPIIYYFLLPVLLFVSCARRSNTKEVSSCQ